MKNKDADATNPNIYHSIDKLDHVYDEIKQKDVGKWIHILKSALVYIYYSCLGKFFKK